MSVEILRKAAALMRERAEAATPGPWRWSRGAAGTGYVSRVGGDRTFASTGWPPDAQHIASWHPAVALAVAEWLDRVALTKETCNPWQAWWLNDYHAALAAARTFLGEGE